MDVAELRRGLAREPQPISVKEVPAIHTRTLEVLRQLFVAIATESDRTPEWAALVDEYAETLRRACRRVAVDEKRYAIAAEAWSEVRQKLHEVRATIGEAQTTR